MIRKTHISAQKPRGRQLNAKVRGSKSAVSSSDHNVQQRYLENGLSTHRHFITKLMLITARSYTITQRLHSSKFTLVDKALPGCCPLRRTPFQMLYACAHVVSFPNQKPRSLIWERDKWTRKIAGWPAQRVYGSCTAGTVSSRSRGQGLCRAHHLGKLLTYSYSQL